MNIAEKLTAIQTEIKAPKNQLNKFGNYKYRSLEDILEALKPYLSKYKVCVILKAKTVDVCGMPYAEGYAKMVDTDDPNSIIETEDGAFVEMNAKGMQMPQKSGSASSYAKKYALGDLLLLDDTKDSDATNDHKTITTSTKPNLSKRDASYERVVTYLTSGKGNIDEVLKKYSVSSALKKELESLV
tara:strand:- start:4584 stop:5141 length:558 start_codon:yes stop_codon:yes gene_type:complete